MPRTNRSNKILSNKTKHLRDSNKKLVNITKQIKYFDNFDDNIFRLSYAITLIYTWIFNSIYTSPNIDYDINGTYCHQTGYLTIYIFQVSLAFHPSVDEMSTRNSWGING